MKLLTPMAGGRPAYGLANETRVHQTGFELKTTGEWKNLS
jgi:hypothetical protein